MLAPLRTVRRWVIRLLEDTEDSIPDVVIPEIPIPQVDNKRATLQEIRDNHIAHLTQGHNDLARSVNGMHIRIGRLEAKLGFQLALQLAIFGTIIGAVFKVFLEESFRALFSGMF